jgi:predicted nucleic acid-binding protein
MIYLIDASSIFEAVNAEKIDVITYFSTVSIARYEIGNVLWKHTHLFKTYSMDQSLEMLKLFSDAINKMRVLDIASHELGILKLSLAIESSFYDASYIYLAKHSDLPLITEDREMARKCREIGLECYSIKEV